MFSVPQSGIGVVHIAPKMTRIKAVVDRVAATVVVLFPILSEGVKYKFENYNNTELGKQKPKIEDRLLHIRNTIVWITLYHFSVRYGLQERWRYLLLIN